MSGILHLGRVPAERAEPADDALLQEVAADLGKATFDIALPQDVMAWKHRKLISNIANVVDALVDDPRAARPAVAAADAEARAVLSAARVAVVDDATEAAARAEGFTVEPVPGLEDTRLGSSTWQSLSRGTGSVETDYLNGEVVRIAHEHGLPAPVNALLARLARGNVRRGSGPRSMSALELVELVTGQIDH
jgi:2-dehydropantoate 2-reductase